MDPAAHLLAAYDAQLRTDAETAGALDVVALGPAGKVPRVVEGGREGEHATGEDRHRDHHLDDREPPLVECEPALCGGQSGRQHQCARSLLRM